MNASGWSWGPQDLGSPDVARTGPVSRDVPVARDMVLEDVETGWVGAVVGVETIGGMRVVGLEDRHGRVKTFPLGPGFLLDGEPVRLAPPVSRTAPAAPRRTRSGSVAVEGLRASVAKESRVWVEGYHDAELVAKVWGHDLAVEGIVVEPLHGIDDLPGAIRDFRPGPGRRLGVLVDHLVPGSKESRIAEQALQVPVLEDPHEDAQRCTEADHVHHQRLDRDDDGSGHEEEQHERGQDDGADRERCLRGDGRGEVRQVSRLTADERVEGGPLVVQVVDELSCVVPEGAVTGAQVDREHLRPINFAHGGDLR